MAYLPPTSEPIICIDWYTRSNSNPDTNGSGICREFELYDGADMSNQYGGYKLTNAQMGDIIFAVAALFATVAVLKIIRRAFL